MLTVSTRAVVMAMRRVMQQQGSARVSQDGLELNARECVRQDSTGAIVPCCVNVSTAQTAII